ncbi:hypothetical protein [Ilumatobacter fluminis]|uniref:hypothetical protein n=1 Tax=Ilumatobacter fluminis TaxID=467091 RepID=UPI00105DB90B|nr:hypothetical protein [Ilumatobacter fluminis]
MINGHEQADESADTVVPARRDAGATFIELLVSIVLLGTIGVAVLVATTAALAGARTSDEIAKSQATVAEVADFLTDTDPENVPWLDCSTLADPSNDARTSYQSTLDGAFPGSVEVVAVLFWDRTTETFSTTCGTTAGYRLQQITFRTVVNDAEREVTVVKRPPDVPTLDLVPAPPAPPYAGGSGQASVSINPDINGTGSP